MSITEETYETSSNISSNYQSPINTQSSNTKTKAKSTKLSLTNIHPDVTFAKILLHILAENKKSKDYYKKINSNQDLHFTVKMRPTISLLD